MKDTIVERLLEPDRHDPECPFKNHCYCDGAPHDTVSHPLAAEAAGAILALRKEVEVARAALREAESVFALVESPSFPDPDYQSRIETLGSDIGYGALMAGASAAWRKCGIIPGGEFVAGPCQATVTRTLEIIRAALATEPVK